MADTQNPQVNPTTPEVSVTTPKVEETTAQPEVISEATSAIQNDLDDLINTTINDSATKQKIDFTATNADLSKKDDKKKALLRARKIPTFIMIFSIIFLAILSIGAAGILFFQYIGYQRTGSVNEKWAEYMPWVETQYDYVVRTLQLEPIDKYTPQQLITTNANTGNIVNRIVDDTDIDFLIKKKVLESGVRLLYKDVTNRFDSYEALKNSVGQQGFFPKTLPGSDQKGFNNSIQDAIIAVESIRFAVAMKYFSLIDSFITQLSSYASMNKELVAQKLQMFVDRGEKDVNLYTRSCYLNGYEIGTSCSTIGDFFNYYNYIDTSLTDADKRLFLLTTDLIQAKLENTDLPSLDVSVQSIDTIGNTINIKVEINTFKEDELKLTLDNGILNPHIYLMTNIINQLRESRYVLTDSINVNQLTVEKKKVRVGGQTVTVNTSSFNFTLPLQNDVQREIYDFADVLKPDDLAISPLK